MHCSTWITLCELKKFGLICNEVNLKGINIIVRCATKRYNAFFVYISSLPQDL